MILQLMAESQPLFENYGGFYRIIEIFVNIFPRGRRREPKRKKRRRVGIGGVIKINWDLAGEYFEKISSVVKNLVLIR